MRGVHGGEMGDRKRNAIADGPSPLERKTATPDEDIPGALPLHFLFSGAARNAFQRDEAGGSRVGSMWEVEAAIMRPRPGGSTRMITDDASLLPGDGWNGAGRRKEVEPAIMASPWPPQQSRVSAACPSSTEAPPLPEHVAGTFVSSAAGEDCQWGDRSEIEEEPMETPQQITKALRRQCYRLRQLMSAYLSARRAGDAQMEQTRIDLEHKNGVPLQLAAGQITSSEQQRSRQATPAAAPAQSPVYEVPGANTEMILEEYAVSSARSEEEEESMLSEHSEEEEVMLSARREEVEDEEAVLSTSEEEEPEARECLQCGFTEPTVKLLPCRHTCYCADCFATAGGCDGSDRKRCPVCRVIWTRGHHQHGDLRPKC